MSDGFLVGRHHPGLLLEGAVDRLLDGHGGLVLVTGEPGIGKTALMKDTGVRAKRRGAVVLFGTCWDGEGAPGYWPWVQVLRAAHAHVSSDRWARCTEGRVDAIAPLLRSEDERPTATAGAVDSVFELQDAVTNLLVACASDTPLVIVLDDIHWADPASVRLLDFLVRHSALAPVLVIAAFRDAEVAGADHPIGPLLEALAPKALTVPLGGIDVDGVEALLLRHGHQDVPRELVADVHRRTGGNPFFVEQTAQLWRAGGGVTAIPPGVTSAVERRLARLDAPTADLLATAALLGNEIDPSVLASATNLDRSAVDARLSSATQARLVAWHDDGALRFVHDLVRESLCGSLPASEAGRRHAAIVEGGDQLSAGRRAYHAYLAVPAIEARDAVMLIELAATAAEGRSAWEEAAGHLTRALELTPVDERASRADTLLRLGRAQRCAGLLDDARRTYDHIAVTARALDDPELFARAALGAHDLGHPIDDDSKAPETAIDAAYAAVIARTGGQPEGALAARLLAAVARTRSHLLGGDRQAAIDASATAVVVARASGDPGALAFSLLARHDAIWRPGTAADRAAIAVEMETAARHAGEHELALQATMLQSVALLEQGDPQGIAEHERFVADAEHSTYPRQRYVAKSRRATIAMLRGDLVAAEAHAEDALAFGRRLGEIDAYGVWGDQIFELARLSGDPARLQALITELRETGDPHVVVLEAMLAVDRGSAGEALRHLDALRDLGERWPQWAALVWISFVAEIASLSKDPDLLEEARTAVGAHIDDWAVLAGGVLIHGPLRYWMARLHAAVGDHDDAIAAFELAMASAERLEAAPWSMLARLGLAEARLDRGRVEDRGLARVALVEVEQDAAAIGMMHVAAAASRRIEALLPAVTAPAPGSSPDPPINEFRRAGDVWWLAFAGRTVQVPDAKGLRDLHLLLSHPGADIAAVILLDPAGGDVVVASRRLGADAVLDDRAKSEFQRRLTSLDTEIERALDRHDDDRAIAAEAERDALIDELKRAAGFGGRDRRLGDESERARKTVTARIRDTLRKLDASHPALAGHLRDTVTTGASCSYRPAGGDAAWRL